MVHTGSMIRWLDFNAPGWGFQDSLLHGQELTLTQPLDCYVMQNILFKVALTCA